MLPMEAVIVTVPPVVRPATPDTSPADTVAKLVLLEFHDATEVTSGEPLQVVAMALSGCVVPLLLLTLPLVGLTVIALMQPTVTVTVCVAEIEGFLFEVAVTVAVPMLADVTRPVAEMVATVLGLMLQVTDGLLLVLPSLLVPNEFICTVLSVLPVSIVGLGGPTESELSVGFTKKPVQLANKATTASTAKAPIKRSFDFFDDMCSLDSSGAPGLSLPTLVGCKNCSREHFSRRALQYLNCGRSIFRANPPASQSLPRRY